MGLCIWIFEKGLNGGVGKVEVQYEILEPLEALTRGGQSKGYILFPKGR